MNISLFHYPVVARLSRISVVIAAVVAVLSLSVAESVRAAGYTLAPIDASVLAGQVMVFEGGGFTPGERVATWGTSPNGVAVSGDYANAGHANGSLRVGFAVPKNAVSGRWSFTAYGETSQTPVITTFEVIGGTKPDQQQVQAAVQPTSGPPGTTFAFVANGYDDSERVSYWFTAPDRTIFAAFPSGDRADEDGRVDFTWLAPSNAPRGTWVVTIQGIGKKQLARAVRFDVN